MSVSKTLLRGVLPCAALLAATAARAEAPAAIDNLALPAGVASAAMAPGAPMRVILSLPLRDAAGAAAFVAAVSNPRSPAYGHYITPEQFGLRFGPSAGTYEYLRQWALSNGLTVGARTASRTTISLAGTSGQFARLFNTQFASFRTAEHGDGYTMLTPPHMPAGLAGRIEGVVGLCAATTFHWLTCSPARAPM